MRNLFALAALIVSESAIGADANSFQMRDAGDLVRICNIGPADPLYANAGGSATACSLARFAITIRR